MASVYADYSAARRVQSIVMNISVCLLVCLFTRITQNLHQVVARVGHQIITGVWLSS